MSKPDFYKTPDIRLNGEVNESMVRSFLEQLEQAHERDSPVILELTTTGGDAESGRRMALEIEISREKHGKDIYFLGKTAVYSAGVTFMSSFPQSHRFITHDTVLLIHERRMDKEVSLKEKPLQACRHILAQLNSQIEMAEILERENFERLAKDTKLTGEEIFQRSLKNWYVRADEALELKLVAGII